MKYKKLNSIGDTIVEVMIVLAVLGMAISVSYATANRSLLDTRQAQENAEAAQYIQAQLEALRSLTSATVTPNPFNTSAGWAFCITQTAPYTVVPLPDPRCTQGLYSIKITYTSLGLSAVGGTFQVQSTWADVEGQGNDTATLVYRLYQTP